MLKRFLSLSLILASALAVNASYVFAEIGAIDAVPAATLLLPYFEVGLEDSGNTTTTLFSINNALDEPVVVHLNPVDEPGSTDP